MVVGMMQVLYLQNISSAVSVCRPVDSVAYATTRRSNHVAGFTYDTADGCTDLSEF